MPKKNFMPVIIALDQSAKKGKDKTVLAKRTPQSGNANEILATTETGEDL